ncbi:FMN-binding negative transcriptional regulator [Qingshengfaniella alkalisoli]|uniref:FMN-binding negative transcriptional regulator n=1 Tax=Qingshengfaniella alkalisoli TaxID=2599296 RepID=A0A5B8I8A2_9RHOB|nr:FMN-binding negative transcriptional regulator [Qingshengfaniella alkalisoli]QDY68866.1 FMN-binding negative transcriptional regulator [Qingshengfaniella alkalisoli]
MYTPPHFQETDADQITAIIKTAPLASIVAQTDDGLIANHIPLLLGPKRRLIGHVALANDMHRLIENGQDVLAIFRSDDAFVSPNFYPSKPEHHRHVPTWNYQVVHVSGPITFQHDTHSKRAAVGLLTRTHERRVNGDRAWKMADAPKDYMDRMLEGIVAFQIDMQRVLGKSKLSQNRDARDYAGTIEGLRATGHGVMADRMHRRASGEK